GVLTLTALNFLPLFASEAVSPDQKKVSVPRDYDDAAWRGAAVQNVGRYKPFETACIEIVRQISGRARLQGQDPVAVVLMWMLELDYQLAEPRSAWDEVPFILCEHQATRKLIYQLQDDGSLKAGELTYEQVHGKYMSPDELRPFRARWRRLREENKERFREL